MWCSREERRWLEKQNKAERQQRKKEENARIRTLVGMSALVHWLVRQHLYTGWHVSTCTLVGTSTLVHWLARQHLYTGWHVNTCTLVGTSALVHWLVCQHLYTGWHEVSCVSCGADSHSVGDQKDSDTCEVCSKSCSATTAHVLLGTA